MIAATCSACRREIVLAQLTDPTDGFRCPFCGVALAPSYATISPRTTARLLGAHAQFVAALSELESLTAGRLRLHRDTIVGPIDERLTANGSGTTAAPLPATPPRAAEASR